MHSTGEHRLATGDRTQTSPSSRPHTFCTAEGQLLQISPWRDAAFLSALLLLLALIRLKLILSPIELFCLERGTDETTDQSVEEGCGPVGSGRS
jgi:hypothetical protein